jgi:hypothetical protein
MITLTEAHPMITLTEIETYPVRRLRVTVAGLSILILVLILIGLSSHRTIAVNRPVWKSAPYGDLRDTGSVRAGH